MYDDLRATRGVVVDAGHPSYLFPSVWYNK